MDRETVHTGGAPGADPPAAQIASRGGEWENRLETSHAERTRLRAVAMDLIGNDPSDADTEEYPDGTET